MRSNYLVNLILFGIVAVTACFLAGARARALTAGSAS